MRFLPILVAALALLGLVGCESTEKPSDSTLPQAQPASWQGGLPGLTPGGGGSGFR
ncbi:MAG: hypothetical protein WCP67_01155 [Verrucomicrobiota bacterium]|jgi:hypothetical protein